MKKIITISLVTGFVALTFAMSPTITGVTAQQRYPWNGKVDISYTVTSGFGVASDKSAQGEPEI